MPPRLNLFTNRQRANSFGGAAHNYDTHRPRYPDQLIDDVLAPGVRRVLEAGAGTGIASMQIIKRGADVLAVEPDTRMAAVAQAKGIPVEIATFEQWDPAGRQFDRVVFAASFHWVDPAVALPKIRGVLADGGKLALIWNRLRPTNPTRAEFESIYRDYMDIEPAAPTATQTKSSTCSALRVSPSPSGVIRMTCTTPRNSGSISRSHFRIS